jgi:starch phosphorylase
MFPSVPCEPTEEALPDGRQDVARAVAQLAERLPAPLAPLARLAFNYWWSWRPDGASVFREVDPALWRRSGCNPRFVLESAHPRRLAEAAARADYVARVQELAAALDAELRRPPAPTAIPAERPVAYFCSEFGVHCSLPLYGGGLGVLAGDVLKAASDMALPMVGVGLLYRRGYFHQRLDRAGWQHEYWIDTPYDGLPAVLVTGPDRRPLTVELAIRRRTVRIQVWRIDVGRVPLYLLDTDRDDNHPIDRWITAWLYIGDRHTRLAQYAVLGIGGVRALEALGIRPSLVHLNEGHGALGAFERLRRALAAGVPFEDAFAALRRETVFTTHTPLAAGNERYGRDEVEPVFRDFLDDLGVSRATLYGLGRIAPSDEHEGVHLTPLALRTSRASNGVSRRHAEVARAMWHGLWPGRAEAEVPIAHVTNGVHTTTWMAAAMQALLDRHLGPTWREHLGDGALWERLAALPDAELWQVRSTLRRTLIEHARERSIRDRLGRGEPPEYVEAAVRVFDPSVLTIGFARRVATYKRLHLLTLVPERGLALLSGPTPIQLVIAGKAHPQDDEAKETLRRVLELRRAPGVGERVVFLEDYDLHIAPLIMAGVDLWLNLPRPPLEASGTSGMKVALNGGLNLSVLDGWWVEAWDGENGWGIESAGGSPQEQDARDAHATFDILEREVVPLFYERDADGIPRRWLARVRRSMRTIVPRFTAERMLRDYVATLYAPETSAPPTSIAA